MYLTKEVIRIVLSSLRINDQFTEERGYLTRVLTLCYLDAIDMNVEAAMAIGLRNKLLARMEET